ncbi:hypothetical protein ACHAW5_005298 [Stephanodiscus triporus]|uniref:Uncharacterized protein n=1 Tax=Stephanodiscus triporus TaxID=2934178 RepID=A0ABD3PJT7_9STRA
MELSPFECRPPVIGAIGHVRGGGGGGGGGEDDGGGRTTTARRVVRPSFDPRYVVKKYRRSAAGGGATMRGGGGGGDDDRTLDMLETTTDYLLRRVFADQMPPPAHPHRDDIDDDDDGDDPNEIRIIWGEEGEIGGVDDAADSQRGGGSSSSSSSLSCHRAEEVRARDEMAAYAAMLHSSAVLRAEETALLPSSSSAVGGGGGGAGLSLMEDGGSGWGALLLQMSSSSVRGRGRRRDRMAGGEEEEEEEEKDDDCDDNDDVGEKYPRWKWALEMACAAQDGNYQRYFSLLDGGPADADAAIAPEMFRNDEKSTLSTEELDEEEAAIDRARFLVLARCCASHSLNLIRLKQIRRYNHAFGKEEKVPALDLARLLRFTRGGDADDNDYAIRETVDFCRDAGLPIVEMNNGDGHDNGEKKKWYIVMKSAPISVKGDDVVRKMCHPGRMNDSFVFGTRFVERGCTSDDGGNCRNGLMSLSNNLSAMNLQRGDVTREDIVDNWEDRDNNVDEESKGSSLAGAATRRAHWCEARKDEDGILIPPSNVLRNLIG